MTELLEPAVARAVLLDAVRVLPAEPASLEAALGRVLAERVVADRDFPPTDRSAMDGFAVRAADVPVPGTTLRVIGELRAGASADGRVVGRGEALRIFTGSVLPGGADAVVMVETTREDPAAGTVRIDAAPRPGDHLRRRGEDFREGEAILEPGTWIRAAEIAALTAVGTSTPRVHPSPRVAVLSTGDEVVEADGAVAIHQVRNSNARGLLAQLAEMGIRGTYLGIAGDEPRALEARLTRGLTHDVLLVTGGVSAGAYDLVGPALEALGARILFHGVSMRPGKPILAATRGSCAVVALPGNPVSAFTGFAVFVVPMLRKMAGHSRPEGEPIVARLASAVRRKPGRTTYALARIAVDDGVLVAHPTRSQGSGDVLSLVRANAFVVVPGGAHAVEAGSTVPALLFAGPDSIR